MESTLILLFILFIFLTLVILTIIRINKKNKENYRKQPVFVDTYKNYKYECMKPQGYHRYGSNLCNPEQDRLPITFPNPNEGLKPIKINSRKEQIICDLQYGII